jgi:hypothetical protein
VVGEKGLEKGVVEYKHRKDPAPRDLSSERAVAELKEFIGG